MVIFESKQKGIRLDRFLKKNPNIARNIGEGIEDIISNFMGLGLDLVREGYTVILPWTNLCKNWRDGKECTNVIFPSTPLKDLYVTHGGNLKEFLRRKGMKSPHSIFFRDLSIQYID